MKILNLQKVLTSVIDLEEHSKECHLKNPPDKELKATKNCLLCSAMLAQKELEDLLKDLNYRKHNLKN